jgi:hypothetical protein
MDGHRDGSGDPCGELTFLPALTRLGVSQDGGYDEVQRRTAVTLSAVTKVRIPITPPLGSDIEDMPNGT